MSAIYDFKENPGQDPDQENPLLYPYLISSGTVPCQKIMEEICRASTFTVPDLQGALHALSEAVIHYLNDGYRVELSHFGYFSPTVGATRPVRDPKKVRSKDIYFNGVNFRPSAAFRKSLNGKLKRARPGQRHRSSSDRSDEECLRLLLDHLKKYPFITRLDYSALTGKLKNTAMKQLKRFIADGHIVSDGTGNRLIYRLPVRE
ncbi:MAG: HU family DNA-binding protein [Bacteroides sp.]|nr:HU family DNA-binding protein [Bacteroides sp.]